MTPYGSSRRPIADQVYKEGIRNAATSGVNEACNDALLTVEPLNPLMENLLLKDAPTLRLWPSARHIERYTARKRAESATDAENPPITQNDAPAATA